MDARTNATFIFPQTTQSDVNWLMENGPDGEADDKKTVNTGPYYTWNPKVQWSYTDDSDW